ncbi:MAG: hypothetical protein WBB28_25615 [Crinalium sp.]
MDANMRRAIEQANAEVAKGSSASSSTVNSLISTLAAYLANADLSPSDKSVMQDGWKKLEELKNRNR